ncbi:hypothetical protein RUM44_012239 [Polyplax serrata]|uniref:Uncharacterized protein n=1 Tax=Polyplax serrata TaxID=468196 RepID=A0ABR1BAQ8_POLSC
MYYFEVCEIGRESVKSVNASILAALIKELVNRYERSNKSKLQPRKFYIRCSDKLEFSPKKYKKIGDDEGFESDGNEEDSLSGDLSNEDAQSTTSSCCLVEDHVFKSAGKQDLTRLNSYGKDLTSLVSIIGSIDSANSSGSSDTDEIEVHSLTPSPTTQSKKILLQNKREYFFKEAEYDNTIKKQTKAKKEEYPISDVIFCHTEPKYPTVIAWVIKKPQSDFGSRLGATGVENFSKIENCLEVVVIKCKNADNLRELCSNYQEYSRRTKLDNYKSIKRKTDTGQQKKLISLTLPTDSKDVKVSLSDMKIANSSLIKASELSILNPKIITSFKNDLKNSVSLNSLIKAEKNQTSSGSAGKTSLVINGTLQSSVKKTQSLLNISKTWESDTKSTLLKENSLDVGDQFNLVQRTDQNGVTHLEVTKTRENKATAPDRFTTKSKLRKEIEGVILTDVESYAKKEHIRQRNGPDETDSKHKIYDCPPIRPERRKYVRKKNAAPPPPVTATITEPKTASIPQLSTSTLREKPKNGFFLSPQNNENQVKKEHKVLRSPFMEVQLWRNQNARDAGMKTWKSDGRGRHVTKYEDKSLNKRRSASAGRLAKKAPMAYRYIYLTNDYRESPPVKRGLPSKIREVGGNLTNSIHSLTRRNSFDDVITYNDNNKSNLKSVIKKNKKINDKYCEPKKVTFSAFATVQVVD